LTTNKDETDAVALLNQLDSFAEQLKTYLEDHDPADRPEQARAWRKPFCLVTPIALIRIYHASVHIAPNLPV
jgi:hypothetical protein